MTQNFTVMHGGLKINVNNTKVLIFEKGRHTSNDFYLFNQRLEVVTSFKYLGVYFFQKWKLGKNTKMHFVQRALYGLFSIINNYEFKTQEKRRLFDTLVASVLNYSSEVWRYNEANISYFFTKNTLRLQVN